MAHRFNPKTAGFSLIEVVVVVAILGIIATVALPSYSNYKTKSQREDGMGALQNFAQKMEQHFAEHNTYISAANGDPSSATNGVTAVASVFASEAPLEGSSKTYDLRVVAVSAGSFTLRAIPKNTQAGDGIIELNSAGNRFWDKNKDGDTADAGEDTWR